MSSFHHALSRFHRRWNLARVIISFMVIAILAVVGGLIHGWFDYQLALSSSTREHINTGIVVVLAVLAVVWLYLIVKTPREKIAHLIDQSRGDSRDRVLSATSLEKIKPDSPMQQFHIDRSLADAAGEIQKLPTRQTLPLKGISLALVGVVTIGASILGLKYWGGERFSVTASRILHPDADIPPYSPLVFKVTPDHLTSLYGGEAIAQVAISGGEIKGDVVCLIRDKNTQKIEKVAAYRERPGHFARKFTNTLAPVEFAFAAGRARSAWHTLDVLMQPKVSGVLVTITPPAYTGKKKESFPLESGEIRAIEGSTVSIEVQSNRPLSGGEMTIKPLNVKQIGVPKKIQGDATKTKSVVFSWIAGTSSEVSALIRDVRSTPSPSPLKLTVKVLSDQVPVVDLSSPQPVVLATPKTKIPFEASVEDDYGLAKVSMVRTLLGFRDRSRMLAHGIAQKSFQFKESLDLGALGVEVGQTLEFYFEAMDRNPSLLGRGVSDVVHIKIISEDDYAQRLRAKVQLEAFTARYQALSHAINTARKSLEELEKARKKNDRAAFEQALKKAQLAHQNAQKLTKKIAEDFQAFEMEKRLSDVANEAVQKLAQNQAGLANLNFSNDAKTTQDEIKKMLDRMGGVQQQAQQVQHDAKVVQQVGRVMEMAATFKKIHRVQKSLVQRFQAIAKEVASGNTTNAGQLSNLARQQEINRQSLIQLAKELKKRADALPPGFEKMQQDVEEFLTSLKQLDIQDPMHTAAEKGKLGKSIDAATNALLALSLMDQLLEKPKNGF